MIKDLGKGQIEALLHTESIGRVGCHDEKGIYLVPITYVYDGIGVICHSAVGRKVRAMRANPSVCFEVDEIDASGNWRSVIAWGQYEELTGDEAATAMSLLVNHIMAKRQPLLTGSGGTHSATPHGDALVGIDTVVYRIRLTEKTGRSQQV